MNFVRTALSELIGLFVDDGALALFTLALIAVVTVAIKVIELSPLVGGIALLVGYIVILAESVRRFSRK